MSIEIGMKYNKTNDRRLYHIVAIVDDGKAVVSKFYGLHKQYWHYEVEDIDVFAYAISNGWYMLKEAVRV